MGKVRDYFESKGIEPSHVPYALLVFKVSTYLNWTGTLFLCYRFRPVRSFFTKWSGPRRVHEYIRTRYKTRYDRWNDYINDKAHKLAEWKYFRPIPRVLGVDPKRFTLALAENVILYKASLPITIPLQIWLIVRVMQQKDAKKLTAFEILHDVDEKGGASKFQSDES